MAGLLVAVLGFQCCSGLSKEHYSVLSSPELSSSPMGLAVEISPTSNNDRVRSLVEQEME